jgi:RHS repeat-associated protein
MFSSKRFDKETGLINFCRRYYDPTLGRFVTADPSGFADGPNLYAYCGGDPVNLIDPDGQLSKSFAPSWTSSSPNINYSFTDGMYGAFSGMQALAGSQRMGQIVGGTMQAAGGLAEMYLGVSAMGTGVGTVVGGMAVLHG